VRSYTNGVYRFGVGSNGGGSFSAPSNNVAAGTGPIL
jgi:hypothetical protein